MLAISTGGSQMKAVFTILLLAATCIAQSAAPTVAQLLGTWQLVSIEDTMKDGTVKPPDQFGPHPQGFLLYESDGHMCATIANGDRPAWKDSVNPSDAEKIVFYDTFIAYCGTFKLDAANSIVTHYPSIAWAPAYVGSTQPRPFKLDGNKLIITVAAPGPGAAQRVLVWQRRPN
jgi:hypothetical protein